MEATLPLLLMVAASFGGGGTILRMTNAKNCFSHSERLIVAFVLGIGAIGWCVFFLGVTGNLGRTELLALLTIMAVGCIFLRPISAPVRATALPSIWTAVCAAGIATMLAFDLLEGLSPPTDGDSLAYHFALPKAFFEAGGVIPVFRAVEGTIPLLQQMGYLAALGVGGELTMTLWTMVSGWAATAMVYVLARRHLPMSGALATALLFISTPAVLYGGGSGQVEVRNAAFVVLAAFAVSEARRTGLISYALLAGVAAGFFIASKYTGLIFATAAGLVLVWQRDWFRPSLAYALLALAAGGQWYGWNAWITGDPLFPLLFEWLDYPPRVPWNEALHNRYTLGLGFNPLDINIIWWLLYPFKATLFSSPSFESLRVGFGPFVLLVLPLATVALWTYRNRLRSHPLITIGWICLLMYTIWFFSGQSQKVRHHLPIYPLLLICVSAGAWRLTSAVASLRPAMVIVYGICIAINLGAASVFTLNYARHIIGDESREAFLVRNIPAYAVASRINNMIGPEGRVLSTVRQLNYHLEVPTFYANPLLQAQIELHDGNTDPERLWHQIRAQKITHLVAETAKTEPGRSTGGINLIWKLTELGCLRLVDSMEVPKPRSRTIPNLGRQVSHLSIFETDQARCPIHGTDENHQS